MSMLASFVQVDPALLDRLRAEPSLVERLFQPSFGLGFDTERMRETIGARGPQFLAGAIDLHPTLREEIEKRLGTTHEALRGGAGAEAILALMQQSLGRGSGKPLDGTSKTLSLDKAWHGLHYLLSGTPELEPSAPPASRAVLGGAGIGEDFAGYGPARCFDAGEVTDIAAALGDPGVEQEAAARFDPERMSELQIYPFGWPEDSRDWLLDSLAELSGFYADAAAGGRGVVTCLV